LQPKHRCWAHPRFLGTKGQWNREGGKKKSKAGS
jgi:hypothetical protein